MAITHSNPSRERRCASSTSFFAFSAISKSSPLGKEMVLLNSCGRDAKSGAETVCEMSRREVSSETWAHHGLHEKTRCVESQLLSKHNLHWSISGLINEFLQVLCPLRIGPIHASRISLATTDIPHEFLVFSETQCTCQGFLHRLVIFSSRSPGLIRSFLPPSVMGDWTLDETINMALSLKQIGDVSPAMRSWTVPSRGRRKICKRSLRSWELVSTALPSPP